MRGAVSFVVVMLLASASLEGQAGPRGGAPQPAKVVKVETPPVPVAKPAADAHAAPVAGTKVAPAKPVAHAPAAPVAPAEPAKPAAKPPARTLEQAAEAIAAALAARGAKPAARAAAATHSSAPVVRAPRVKRYTLNWPADDTQWDVRWPVVSSRVALTWEDPSDSAEPVASH